MAFLFTVSTLAGLAVGLGTKSIPSYTSKIHPEIAAAIGNGSPARKRFSDLKVVDFHW